MAAIGKVAASAVSATNEVNLGLATFNIDFSLVKVEAPVEYRGLRNALSRRRVENAEQGPLHRTARRLGALFESILPPIQTLAEAYGRRASDIAATGKLNRQGSSRDGPFASHVGFDGTSIYAAATSGSSAIAVHLLACLLARTWSGPEAIAIWVEIVKERKKDIEENTDPSQLQSLPARVAAQQEISRSDLAAWDASARAWLLSADEVQNFNLTQLRLIIKDSGLFVSSIGATYKSVIDVWTTAMKTLQDLILGKPQRISKGALLVGLSCWHIYPDLNIVGPLTHVRFNDELVDKGGIVTLGLQSATPGDDLGIRWSLSLSHLRYYGGPVTVTTSSGANGSRITMEELHMIALGAVFGAWGACITDPLLGARAVVVVRSLLGTKTDLELETRKPAFFLLWSAAKRLIECSSDTERQSNLCLIAFGRRRAQHFLLRPTDTLSPVFGFADPDVLWRAISPNKGISSTTIEEVENLRNFARRCGLAPGQSVIRFRLPNTPNHIFAYTTAIPVSQHQCKRDPEGNDESTGSHMCWVTDASKLNDRSLVPTSIAQILEYVDPAELVSHGGEVGIEFSWITAPESFRADPDQLSTDKGDRSLKFRHWIGKAGRSSLFRVDGRPFRSRLSDREIINIIEAHSSNFSNVADSFFEVSSRLRFSEVSIENEKDIGSEMVLSESLRSLADASSMYRQLSGATVSISIINVPMYGIGGLMWRLKKSLPAQFACIAMFETGSNDVDEKQLSSTMALSSGNSIYVANDLLQDPLKPNLYGLHGITRIVGNIGRPGVVMLAPPQAPLIRPDDPGSWRVINHINFDGSLENSFPETSLHLSFTEYEVPLSVPIGARDADVSIVETLISTHDRQSWVADLDILASLRSERMFRRLSPPRCKHEHDRPRPLMESPVTQIGRISRKDLVSVNSWEELLDPPAGLGVSSIGVVRAFDNWHARVATMSVSVQKGLRTVVLPTEPLCTRFQKYSFMVYRLTHHTRRCSQKFALISNGGPFDHLHRKVCSYRQIDEARQLRPAEEGEGLGAYAPARPEGFYTRLGFSDIAINSQGVYVSAIKAVSEWSDAAWDSLAFGEGSASFPILGVSLGYDSISFVGPRTYLKWSHVFLGIADSVTEMTLRHSYRELSVGLHTERGWVGVVRFEPMELALNTTGDANSTLQPSNSSFEPLIEVHGNGGPRAVSGRAVDPKQPKLALTWEYDAQAPLVQSSEIHTAIIDAMINAAAETDVIRRQQIYGHSATELYEISIESVQPLWSKWFLIKALRLLAHVFLKERRWQAMDFSMTWSGQEVAKGYLWERIGERGSGSTEMATSK